MSAFVGTILKKSSESSDLAETGQIQELEKASKSELIFESLQGSKRGKETDLLIKNMERLLIKEIVEHIKQPGEGKGKSSTPQNLPMIQQLPKPLAIDQNPNSTSLTTTSDSDQSLDPIMEMRLAPTRVQHEEDLPTLFSTPAFRSEAEVLLSGIGDVPHFERTRHNHDIVLSSHHGVIVGHLVDEQGYHCTDIMLLHMGLITPVSPGSANGTKMLDLNIQYSTSVIHFYPDLGGTAPPGWKIPYIIPPVIDTMVSTRLSPCFRIWL